MCAEVTGCIHGDVNARLSARPRLTPDELARFAEKLSELARRMRDGGMRMAYHHHMGTVIQSAEDVEALLEALAAALRAPVDLEPAA